jgi:hypothetical protein
MAWFYRANGEGVVVAQGVAVHPRLLARIVTCAMMLDLRDLRTYLIV